MHTANILWFDLRFKRNMPSTSHLISHEWQVKHLEPPLEVLLPISNAIPTVLIFEFDRPDILALSTLNQMRQQFTAVPILMLTEYHSEALAVWALRSRVSNYLVVPISSRELTCYVKEAINTQITANPIPSELSFHNASMHKTAPAIDYIKAHYHEKVLEEWAARLCYMSISSFSRLFKKEQGKTFREYLLHYRINQAAELLKIDGNSITDVAFNVGFNDLSYFSRMFKQLIKKAPTEFKQKNTNYRQKNAN